MYIVIAGAGLVGRGLAEALVESRHDVVVIDRDRAVCKYCSARLGALVVTGSATSIDVLEQAGIEKADVAVGTMRGDADNLAFSVLAKSFGVPRVAVRMRNRRYETAYHKAGVTTTVHVPDVFVNQLILEIEEPHLKRVATFGAGEAAIVVDHVPEGARVAGMSIGQITADPGFPAECVITGLYRGEAQDFIIPRGAARMQAGDRVFLVATPKDLRKASKFIHKRG